MTDIEGYTLIWIGIFIGIGIGWLAGGISARMRSLHAFGGAAFWLALSFGVRPLINAMVLP